MSTRDAVSRQMGHSAQTESTVASAPQPWVVSHQYGFISTGTGGYGFYIAASGSVRAGRGPREEVRDRLGSPTTLLSLRWGVNITSPGNIPMQLRGYPADTSAAFPCLAVRTFHLLCQQVCIPLLPWKREPACVKPPTLEPRLPES